MFGFTLRAEEYELKSIQTSILQLAAYEVTARDSDTVYVNGKALTAEQAISTGAKLFYDGHLREGYPSPTLTTYRFTWRSWASRKFAWSTRPAANAS